MTPWERGSPASGRGPAIDSSGFEVVVDIRRRFSKSEAELLAELSRLPADWRERLPKAESNFRKHLAGHGPPNRRGWAMGWWPFRAEEHDLAVNLSDGDATCPCFGGCGLGGLVSFHQWLTGQGFEAAVLDLLGTEK